MPLSDYEMILENNRLLKSVIANITGDKWLTTSEAAKYIKKSVTHLRGRLKDQIGFQRSGKDILFRRGRFRQVLNERLSDQLKN